MAKQGEQIRVEYVSLATLKRWPRNPKMHDKEQIQKSIGRFGFVDPITVDEKSGHMVAGHGRLETLEAMKLSGQDPPERIKVAKDGDWLVPVIRGVSFANSTEAEAYLIATNRLVEIGGWDEKALTLILDDLRKSSYSLSGVGWDEKELDRMVAEVTQEPVRDDTPGDLADTFLEGSIKQLVLYFPGAEFDAITERLQKIMEAEKLESHTAVFKKLVEVYERQSGIADVRAASPVPQA